MFTLITAESRMKGAELLPYIQLAWLGAAWIAIIFIAALVAPGLNPTLRRVLWIASLISVPSYVQIKNWYGWYLVEKASSERRASAERSSVKFRELCAETVDINVRKTISRTAPIDVRVVDFGYPFGLNLLSPHPPDKGICWLDRTTESCKPSNIGDIEWVDDYDYGCGRGTRAEQWCRRRNLRYSRGANAFVEVDGLRARFALFIRRPEPAVAQVDRFRVQVVNMDTMEILAETVLYRWLKHGYPDIEEGEPIYCPPRDKHIADLLSQVFPLSSGNTEETGREGRTR